MLKRGLSLAIFLVCPCLWAADPGHFGLTTLPLESWAKDQSPRPFRYEVLAWDPRPRRSATYAELSSGVFQYRSVLAKDLFLQKSVFSNYVLPSDVNLVAELGGLFSTLRQDGRAAAFASWFGKVCSECAWDFKSSPGLSYADRRAREPFGNLWFGLTGRAIGLPERVLDAGAAAVSIRHNRFRFGFSWQFLGDEPADWYASHDGMGEFDSGAWAAMVADMLPALRGMSDGDRRWFGVFGAAEHVARLEHLRVQSLKATALSPLEASSRMLKRQRDRNKPGSSPLPARHSASHSKQPSSVEADRIARGELLRERDVQTVVRPKPRTRVDVEQPSKGTLPPRTTRPRLPPDPPESVEIRLR